MLGAAATVLRPVVMWLSTAAINLIGYSIIDTVLNNVQSAIRDYYGISEDEAGAVMTNLFLDAAAFTGVGAATLWLKLPTKIATRLALDPKKPKKRTVPAAAAAKIQAKDLAAGGKGFKGVLGTALKVAGIPAALVWLTSALANIVEPGIYKPEQTNAVYERLGIPFRYPTGAAAGTPGGFESGEFSDYFRALEVAGAYAIENPCKLGSFVFSRDELAALVDCIYGREAAAGNPTTAAKLKPKLAPYIKTKSTPVFSSSPSTGGGTASSGGGASASAPVVFTGLLSQGTLGDATNFEPRPDDLITDASDLEDAMRNNLAPFLAALPGRVVYEVKVQASYTTKDGFTIRGTTQRVQSGTYANGAPKYKTLTNKFAVANLYVLTAKGTRTKIDQIVLGPTDAATFNPAPDELMALENEVRSTISTTYPTASSRSKAGSSPKESTPEGTGRLVQPKFTPEPSARYIKIGIRYYKQDEDGIWRMIERGSEISALNKGEGKVVVREGIPGLPPAPRQTEIFYDDTAGGYFGEDYNDGTDALRPIPYYPYVINGVDRKTTYGGNADAPTIVIPTNLSQFFTIRGLPLPTVEERALSYEQYGHGPRSLYTGTAEQNAKLLDSFIAGEITKYKIG